MNWENLFEQHILERGYDYYSEEAVENLAVFTDRIRADVSGSQNYEVEISMENGRITQMHCSCPYADNGGNCKHMAAVLYEWEANNKDRNTLKNKKAADRDLFITADTTAKYDKKKQAIQKLVESADASAVKSYLASILAEDEKLLVRFHGIVNGSSEKVNVKQFIRQVDTIARQYLGRNHFISYREANGFLSELEDILAQDVQRMIDNRQYMGAFELMNHIFVLVGSVDMDDSDGGIGMMADEIYRLWVELLANVSADEKNRMFHWFTTHLDGAIVDYMEEYIEQMIMEEFQEKEYLQQKMVFVEEMIRKSGEKDSEWGRRHYVGKWAARYLDLLEQQKCEKNEIEDFCRKYWENPSVRRYYIDRCVREKEYDLALKALDESILLDEQYRGLVSDYSMMKKEIYQLQGDKDAYLRQLWELILSRKAGDLDIYRELKKQYTEEEWLQMREEVFEKLPKYAHVEQLYQEEKLYDRLLDFVLHSSGLYALQQYAEVLKEDYSEQILQKYTSEVNQLASRAGDRRKYKELVALLRSMRKIRGGSKAVDAIAEDWKVRYKNRPALMDELEKL